MEGPMQGVDQSRVYITLLEEWLLHEKLALVPCKVDGTAWHSPSSVLLS